MSPFSTAFRELRIFCGLRQAEFAARLGYEQSYVSAIEVGTKGPPTTNFVMRLVNCFELDEVWQTRLLDSLEMSQRKIILPSEAPEDVYRMFNELRRQLNNLHPAQVELIQVALRLPESMSAKALKTSMPLKRKVEPRINKVVEI